MRPSKTKSSDTIVGSVEQSIGRLIFNNPRKYNALTQSCWEAIPQKIDELMNKGARVLIVSGENENFCSGADVSEFDVVRKDTATAQFYEQTNRDAFKALRTAPIPTIAKIKGYCLGGGFGLAAACDLRIAAHGALFGVPAAKLGLAYPVAAMTDIVHAIGAQHTKQMLFTADRFTAAQMHEYGFLREVFSEDVLETHVFNLATKISELAPLTHHATKAAISAAHLDTSVETAMLVGDSTFTSADYSEGRKAFIEKRKAKFTGS